MSNSIWIIELWVDAHRRYEPTIGAGLDRGSACRILRNEWRLNLPNDRMRVVRYVPAPAPKKAKRKS